MRFFIIISALFACVSADSIAVQTMGCPSESTFAKLDDWVRTDPLALQRFANKNGCAILSPSDTVTVLENNPSASKKPYMLIRLERTGTQFFVPRRAIMIEQPGQENSFSF